MRLDLFQFIRFFFAILGIFSAPFHRMVTWTARLCWLNTSPLDLPMFQGNLCLYNRLMLGIVNLFGGSSACTVSIIGNFFHHLRFRLVTWNPLKRASCWVKGTEFSFLKLIIRISWKKVQILEKLFWEKKSFLQKLWYYWEGFTNCISMRNIFLSKIFPMTELDTYQIFKTYVSKTSAEVAE